MKVLRLLLLFILVVTACSVKKKANEVTASKFKLKYISKIDDERIASISQIISGEKGEYLVADWQNNEIFIFSSKNDSIIRGFGNKGKGPGEFSKLTDICIDNQNNIYATDQGLNRIQVFNNQGKLIKTLKTEFPNVGICVTESDIYVNSLNPLYAIYRYDKSGKLKNKLVKLQEGKNAVVNMLKNISRFSFFDNKIYRILYNSPDIYTISDTSAFVCNTDKTVKNYVKISFTAEENTIKINRGTLVHTDLISDEMYIYLVGGGGKSQENKLENFLNIYDKKWNLLSHIQLTDIPYSEDGYSICKIGDFIYFATINDNTIFKFKLEKMS